MRRIILAALLACPLVAGCVKANPPTDTGDVVTTLTSPSTPGRGSTGTTGTTGSTGTTTSSTSLAYNPDIQALLQSDCVSCHGASRADGGVRLNTYAVVMTQVRAGNSSSRLITSTRQNGSMYRYWSGTTATRQAKATQVQSWVVTYNAQETR